MKDIDIESFKWGIEHEFLVLNANGALCDYTNTTYDDFARIIEKMPVYSNDYTSLRRGDLGIKSKRWYIEGLERFNEQGEFDFMEIKGFEIRTPQHESLEEAVNTLKQDIETWKATANDYGYIMTHSSFNPWKDTYTPLIPLNSWERSHQDTPEDQTNYMALLTAGPDINFSSALLDVAQTIDLGKKLTFYSPYIVPFSFSSPFYRGELWGGLSRRTYYRTGKRPAVFVYVENSNQLIKSAPSLTNISRMPTEVGRIEFKAFDMVADIDLYLALGSLLLGIALDTTLKGRSLTPNEALHKHSATHGFKDAVIHNIAEDVLSAAEAALPSSYRTHLKPLQKMLDNKRSPADNLIERFNNEADLLNAIIL